MQSFTCFSTPVIRRLGLGYI